MFIVTLKITIRTKPDQVTMKHHQDKVLVLHLISEYQMGIHTYSAFVFASELYLRNRFYITALLRP